MSEGTLCKTTTFSQPVGNLTSLSLYQEIGYVNNSNKVIYVGTSYGNRIALDPSKLVTTPTDTLTIYIRMTNGAARKFDGYKEIISKEGLVVNVFDIPLRRIQSEGYYYLEDLDLCFCFDPNKIVDYHKKLDRNIDKTIDAEIKVALQAHNDAPVKIFGNDAPGTFNTIWVTINKLLTCCTITNTRDTGSYIRVSVGTTSGKYNDYDVDIDKIRKGEIVEVITSDGIIALGPSEGSMRSYLFTQEHADGVVFTQDQLRKHIDEECKERDKKIKQLKDELERQKFKTRVAEETNKVHEATIEQMKTNASEFYRNESERTKRENEEAKFKYDQLKRESEERMRQQDNTTDIILSILKVAAASIPIAIGIYTAIKKNS